MDRVLHNVADLVDAGIAEIEFADDEFLGGRSSENLARARGLAIALAELRREKHVDLTFRIFLEPYTVFRSRDPQGNERVADVLRCLKRAGLHSVYFGVESGSATQLRRYGREGTLDDMKGAIASLSALGIAFDAGFIMFDPHLSPVEIAENIAFFRGLQLIRHNQWPFRPLVVNAGADIYERLTAQGCALSECVDFMCYGYQFRNPVVARIAQIVEDLSRPSRALFYALKSRTKALFAEWKRTPEIWRCQQLVEENGLAYLDLMEALLACCPGRDETAERQAVEVAKARIEALVRKVHQAIRSGLVTDTDGFLTAAISKVAATDHAASLALDEWAAEAARQHAALASVSRKE